MNERAQILLSLAAYMKQLSERYETTFIVVNQVSALFHDRKMSCTSMGRSSLTTRLVQSCFNSSLELIVCEPSKSSGKR